MSAALQDSVPQLKPGIYEGVSMETYLKMPACSSGAIIDTLDRCPRAAWYDSWLNPHRPADSSTPAQSVGTLAHELFLEGTSNKLAIINPEDYPGPRGGIPKGWTTDAIKAARDEAVKAGKVPVFPKTAAAITAMAEEAKSFVSTLAKEEPAVHDLFQPGGGKSEIVLVWEEDGCLFRVRPDRLSNDYRLTGDMKTTAAVAEPDRWGRTQLFGMSYYVAAAFYRRAIKALLKTRTHYHYLVQEQAPPHLCSLIGLNPSAEHLGDVKVERGMAIWKHCMKTGVFPGYPARAAYPDTPQWEMAREEIHERHGNEYAPEKLEGVAIDDERKLGLEDEGKPFAELRS